MSKTSRFVIVALAALVAVVVPSAPPRVSAAENTGDYYYNAGRRIPIVRSDSRVALLVHDDAKRNGAATQARALSSVRSVRDLESSGVLELTVSRGASKAPSQEIASIARSANGSVLPVFFEPGVETDASTLFIGDEVLVQFKSGVARDVVDRAIARLGADAIEELEYAPNGFRLRVGSSESTRNALTVANALFETGLCLWSHPNFLAHRSLRFVPNDPRYPNQWHLDNTGQFGGTAGADVKAQAAWDVTQGSTSISVADADTGIDWHHEDLEVTVDSVAKIHDPRDVVHGDADPYPGPNDQDTTHGSSTAGVAVAAFNNTIGVAGIAPKCRLVPIQLYAESTFTPNATEADAFTWAADHADIMTNSWGPDNPFTPLPDATRAAIDYCNTTGRGGKGTVVFFAAGNDNQNIDSTSGGVPYDSYSSYSGVVAIAASTNLDNKAGYSSFGASISVCAPSSGGTRGINTTTFNGTHNGYTSSFSGTSSACPLAAGVGALVLSVNPNLTWREVKSVLEQSADKIDVGSSFGVYDALGHSIYYGYGRVNAARAVALAVAGGPDTPGIYTSNGTYFLRNSNSNGPAELAFGFGIGGAGVQAIAGDWDGNGTDTIGFYEPATSTFFLRNSNSPGNADLAFPFGTPGTGSVAVVGDWDGNGSVTVGLYVPSTGTFFLRNSNTPGPADLAFQFGPTTGGYLPIAGDWNGDGTDTIGIYTTVTSAFFLKNSNGPGVADAAFVFGTGGAGYRPVAGDWDNDGSDSIGLYLSSNGGFFLKNSNGPGAADATFVFGAGTATPLAGNWDAH